MDKKEIKNTEVVVMGETVSQNKRQKHKDSSSVIWGMLLIFIGVIFFLTMFAGVSPNIWERIWQYWPFLLILFGVHLILGNNIFAKIILLFLSIILFGLTFLLSLVQVNPDVIHYLPKELVDIVKYSNVIKTI